MFTKVRDLVSIFREAVLLALAGFMLMMSLAAIGAGVRGDADRLTRTVPGPAGPEHPIQAHVAPQPAR